MTDEAGVRMKRAQATADAAAASPPRARGLPHGAEQFRLLVEAVVDYAIFLLDAEGHVLTWNVGAERIKGYRADEIIGKHFSRFYTPEDVARGRPQWILRQAATMGRIEDEGLRVRNDGTRFFADVVVTALRSEDGEISGFAKVTRDTTERRAAAEHQRQLEVEREARRVAEEALRTRDRFLSIASHELKTPVATIQVVAEALLRAHAEGRLTEPRLTAGLARIDGGVQRLGALLGQLLDVSRLTAGPAPLMLVPTDVGALVHDVVLQFRDLDEGDRIDFDAAEEAMAPADALRLEQVITNLLSNALRYSEPPARVRVRVRQVEGSVELTVADEGIGFDADAKRLLFQSFGRAANAAEIPGLGLGLYISRQIVELHHGTIEAASAGIGRGSTFTVRLPAAEGS